MRAFIIIGLLLLAVIAGAVSYIAITQHADRAAAARRAEVERLDREAKGVGSYLDLLQQEEESLVGELHRLETAPIEKRAMSVSEWARLSPAEQERISRENVAGNPGGQVERAKELSVAKQKLADLRAEEIAKRQSLDVVRRRMEELRN